MSDFFGIKDNNSSYMINKSAIKFVKVTDCQVKIIFDEVLNITLIQDNNKVRDETVEDLKVALR